MLTAHALMLVPLSMGTHGSRLPAVFDRQRHSFCENGGCCWSWRIELISSLGLHPFCFEVDGWGNAFFSFPFAHDLLPPRTLNRHQRTPAGSRQ